MSKIIVVLGAWIIAAVAGGGLAVALKSPAPQAVQPQIVGAPAPPHAPLPPPVIPPNLPPGITPVGRVNPGNCGCAQPTTWVGVPNGQFIPVPAPNTGGYRTGANFLATDGKTYYEMCPGM